MSEGEGGASGAGSARWCEAALAASLLAVDPAGAGGVALRARVGPVRDRWLGLLRDLLPVATPMRRVPLNVADERLLGGLDLAATLRGGRPVADRGLLVESDGGVLVLASAERLGAGTAARLGAVLDTGEVALERDGLALRTPTRLAVLALDEGIEDDERPPAGLLDRVAFHLDLDGLGLRDLSDVERTRAEVETARARLPQVQAGEEILEGLCEVAAALGVASLRAPLLALRVARVAAALEGRDTASMEDASLAARLVLAPRATRLPAAEQDAEEQEAATETPGAEFEEPAETPESAERPLAESVLEAAQAAIPPGLLARLKLQTGTGARSAASGKAGQLQKAAARGRPLGVRRGEAQRGRLNVVETLRAAAPWQPLRRREGGAPEDRGTQRVKIRRDDFRLTRFKRRSESTAIFVVDASGSAAFHRLAEAKGAVELLLADCYVRRDRVALVAFRGRGAELLLPPTRSLARAKRSLAGLPGGGGTPLSAGIDLGLDLAAGVRRKGSTAVLVLLTDGRPNVGRDGAGGRAQAGEDALASARLVRVAGVASLVVDTSPHPEPSMGRLAEAMGALYIALPHADAASLSQAVRGLQVGPAGRDAV